MHQQLKRPREEQQPNNDDKETRTTTMVSDSNINTNTPSSAAVSLQLLAEKMADFAKERDWDKFHSPRNLLLALVGEVGELSEIFQWKGEVERGLPGWDEAEKQHLGEELSDVLLYLVRLSDICGVDLGQAALRKMELNARKYPANACSGSSKKHTHYTNSDNVVINAGKESLNDDNACGAVGGV